MGDFYNAIKDDLDAADDSGMGGPGPFGIDYSTNAAVVRQVQAAINALGYAPPLTVDGAIGPKTTEGVKWLQAQRGLDTDGVIGDQTLGALGITPPGGTSVQSATGAVKGALAAIKAEFAPLLDWSQKYPQPITQGKGVAPGFQATRASVVNSFVDWTTPLEGWLPFMYIDALGYVTTGMGNLIDPISEALKLPWKRSDGSLASQDEIRAAWNAVDALRSDTKGQKQTSGAATQGGGSQGGATSIRLTKADVQALVAAKLRENEAFILAHMPSFAQAPADAQLGGHSMSWAMGPGWVQSFHALRDAFDKGDYATAAAQSHMQGTGIDMRNMANKLLFTNAALAKAKKADPDYLYYIAGLEALTAAPASLIASIIKSPLKLLGAVVITAGVVAGTVFAFRGRSS